MNTENTISILNSFTDITIFRINDNGDIKEIVVNSKETFKPKGVKNIYDYFSNDNKERLRLMIDSGIEQVKKYFTLKKEFNIKDSIDVEVKTLQGEIYVAFKFSVSSKERELMYEEALNEITSVAKTDSMTKLLNRYGYWERVKAILNCGDPERRLGILVVDVDHLKQLNDTKGHKVGDKAIKQVSYLISSSIRQRDVAVRYGGDEFVIVVEELSGSKSTAYGLGKRLVRLVNDKKVGMMTTISVGVHVTKVGNFEKHLNDETKLRKEWDKEVEIADKMVYKAKENGRNQVVFSESVKN